MHARTSATPTSYSCATEPARLLRCGSTSSAGPPAPMTRRSGTGPIQLLSAGFYSQAEEFPIVPQGDHRTIELPDVK